MSVVRAASPLLVFLALAGCRASEPAARTPTTAAAQPGGEVLPFIHDDYPRALAEAKQRKKPLFVDAWATWCHSCLSLRTQVLTDPSLAPLAGDFVWLSVDTEKDQNAQWVSLHPHSALPTLWVIDPATDRPILKWAGTATAAELRSLLQVAALGAKSGDGGPAMEATAAFLRGNHALAAGDGPGAEREYRAALAAAPKGDAQRARIVEALVTDLSIRKVDVACAAVAAEEAPALPAGTSRATTIVTGLGCAAKGEHPAFEPLLALAVREAKARDASLLPDDRSALYEAAVEAKKERKDLEGAKALAGDWAAFLEGEAAKARTNEARAALDAHRLSAYLVLGDAARGVPMLERSERDFPADYNPPARLGRAFLELKRLDDAAKAADRAAARVYGPRAMRVLALKADIAKARGDRPGEVAALEEALARSERAVLTEGQKGVRESLVKRLAGLRGAQP